VTVTAALSDVASIAAGNPAPKGPKAFDGGTHPFIRTSDVGVIHIGAIGSSRDLVNDATANTLRKFPAGTVLMPKSGASTFTNHRVLMGVDGFVSSHLAAITADKSKALDRYLFYALQTVDAKDLIQDHAYPSLTLKVIGSIKIQLPPIDEQRRIVAKLDAISAQVAAATENRKAKALALKAVRSALLQQLCMEPHPGGAANEVWPLVALQEITTLFTDGDWIESKDQASDGVRLLQTGNVGSGAFLDRRSKARFISDETFGRLRCTEVLTGDCLISRLPDPVGRACLVPESDSRMITAVDCTIVRFDATRITPEYFVYYSGSYSYQLSVDALTTGATRSRISRKNLGGIPVPLPPLDEQRRIVAKLDEATAAIDSLESGVDAAAQELDALTASALSSLLAAGT